MGIWSMLFNSQKNIETVTDAVISTGDKLFYTDEEKADMNYKLKEYFPTLLKAYEPFKIAQRILAIWFSFLFGSAFITGLGMAIFNSVSKYIALKNGESLDTIITLDIQPIINLVIAFDIGWIVIAIVSFYFLGGTMESYNRHKEK